MRLAVPLIVVSPMLLCVAGCPDAERAQQAFGVDVAADAADATVDGVATLSGDGSPAEGDAESSDGGAENVDDRAESDASCPTGSFTVGPHHSQTAYLISEGHPWASIGSVETSDDGYATVGPLTDGEQSDRLTMQSYGFSIPATATIQGVVVTLERGSERGEIVDKLVTIHSPTPGTNRAMSGSFWSIADDVVSYGGSADTWGLPLTPAEINNGTFGVDIAVQHSNVGLADTARIDASQLWVYYTCP